MEIIKRGKPPSERIWAGTCQNCGSKIQAKEKEVSPHYDQRDGTYAIAQCPVCTSSMYFYPIKWS